MDFSIIPLAGVGVIRYGMTKEVVRRLMPSPFRSFMKAPWSKMPTDAFFDSCVHVFYSASGECEAVEFYGRFRVLLNGANLLRVPYSEAKRIVLARCSDIVEDGAGFTCYSLGVGAYAPSNVEYPDDPTESIIAFRVGYYDSMEQEEAMARIFSNAPQNADAG